MEEIRFISESVKVDEIPEGSGRLFIFRNEETRLSDLVYKTGMDPLIRHSKRIPEGHSEFIVNNIKFIIVNIIGEGMMCFPENEHKGI